MTTTNEVDTTQAPPSELLRERHGDGGLLTGWGAFLSLWFGQTVSMLGSGLFAFGIGVWVYQRTGSATLFALVMAFDLLPGLLLAPYAGLVVDRVNRRTVMILGNAGAALSTALVALFVFSHRPEIWLLYPPLVLGSLAGVFLGTAYDAALAPLIPERQLGRANGLIQVGQALAEVLAPLAAGVLLLTIQVGGLIVLDFISFLVAIASLLPIRIPRPAGVEEEEGGAEESLGRRLSFGWRYIRSRSPLLALVLMFAVLNFFVGIVTVGVAPLVLSFGNAAVLGTAMAAGGAGMLGGGLIMSAWGGTRRRIVGLLGGLVVAGCFIALEGLRPSPILVAASLCGFWLCLPVINASSQAIWQSQVPMAMQGRVFSVRRTIAQVAAPLAYLVAGPLIDYGFKPLRLPAAFLGEGPERGIGLLFVIMGLVVVALGLAGAASSRLRGLEGEVARS